ncbi:MAG: alkaline phosphatase PhoX [Pyrinomonadaceae bacterium]
MRHTALAGGAALALEGLFARNGMRSLGGVAAHAQGGAGGYGPLVPKLSNNTGETLLALPEGFQYNVFGKVGAPMADGRLTPGAHDGMAAYDVNGMIHLVRNHEQSGGGANSVAFGSLPYDPKATGGTTTLIVDPVSRLLVYDFVSLSGTVRNCAGGPTPWGSWLTCEETTVGPAANNFYTKPHGYVFDIPAGAYGETPAVALNAMGRFSHEAVAVDPATGVVYETEDANPSGFYRFIPNRPGFPGQPANLAAGGVLQMLAVKNQPQYDTRTGQTVGQEFEVVWVNIDNPDPLAGQTSVVNQGIALGGALFERLEGCWYDAVAGSFFFISTSGGTANLGQVWQYTPAGSTEGVLKLFYESSNAATLEAPDNILVSPRGGLVLCEDGGGVNYVRGLSRQGVVFDFASRIGSNTEAAGATFSRDGQTLFFNYQGTGETYAVWPREGFSWADGAL